MKILIIEDEKAVSNDLVSTIGKLWIDRIESIVQVYSVKEAINFFKNEDIPDLIFSDIQLGDGACFDIFREMQISAPIIFCTAYDEYAIQAFKSNGIEYILKPFLNNTIKKALDKYDDLRKSFVRNHSIHNYGNILRLLSEPREENRVASILVFIKDEILPIQLEEIALFFLDENEVYLLTFDGKRYLPNKSLEEIEKITGNYFFRANRQFLVSRKVVSTAYSFFSRKLALNLNIDFSTQIIVSREKKSAFLDWLIQSTS
ncbi:response regulator transcription factor [Elizabethkingia anophelis]|nr:response regulator transcription factor [Elizabethkingia anophelis]